MVGCDMCFKWYHTKCIDLDDGLADIADYFHCTSCIEQKFKPMLNYWLHTQQKKINKGNNSVMDIILNNLQLLSRKLQSLNY